MSVNAKQNGIKPGKPSVKIEQLVEVS